MRGGRENRIIALTRAMYSHANLSHIRFFQFEYHEQINYN